jgi:hypothetical protein
MTQNCNLLIPCTHILCVVEFLSALQDSLNYAIEAVSLRVACMTSSLIDNFQSGQLLLTIC